MSDEWSWKVGILNGLGECFWQQCGGVIRRVSRIIMTQNGQIGLMKNLIGGALMGTEEIDGTSLVCWSAGATDEQQKNCNSLWSSIVPVNGASRFKLDK